MTLFSKNWDQFDGDVAMFMDRDGAEMVFRGGQPVMDVGLETAAFLSLLTDVGWVGNMFLPKAKRLGSNFVRLAQGTLTLARLNLIRQEAENALAWMVERNYANDVGAQVTNPRANDLRVIILIEPLEGDIIQISLTRTGGNWIPQIVDPAHRKMVETSNNYGEVTPPVVPRIEAFGATAPETFTSGEISYRDAATRTIYVEANNKFWTYEEATYTWTEYPRPTGGATFIPFNGGLYCVSASATPQGLYKWNGVGWDNVLAVDNPVLSIGDNRLLGGGDISIGGGVAESADGTTWSVISGAFSTGTNFVRMVEDYEDGIFATSSNLNAPLEDVRRYQNESVWIDLGAPSNWIGMRSKGYPTVDGDEVWGMDFPGTFKVRRWTGSAWQDLGEPQAGFQSGLAKVFDTLYALPIGGDDDLRKWNGSSWEVVIAIPSAFDSRLLTYDSNSIMMLRPEGLRRVTVR